LARCKADSTTSPTLARLLRKLRKKYRHIEGDLAAVIPEIEADYTTACNAARPPKRKLGIEHWKYDFGSTDLQRSPRNSFRVIGIFLEQEAEGKERTMFLSIAYFKGDQADITDEEVKDAVAELRSAILQGDLPEDDSITSS
jgi:hypothetical protein